MKAGKLRHYGVSVEKVEEALKAIEFPERPNGPNHLQHFPAASGGIVFRGGAANARWASSRACRWRRECCRAKSRRESTFAKDDHRNFNRHGEAFDRGETFSGVDFETGLRAVEELKTFVPKGATLAQLALRWILEFPAVTCAIPGAKRPAQVAENIAAVGLAAAVQSDDEKNPRDLRRAD